MIPDLPKERLQDLLRQMLLIRRAEEQVIHFHAEGQNLIRGHFHVYIGQEATGVGVCAALGPDDYVFTTHRNHGHVLARGGEPGPVLAEIIGRATGYNKGRGGTFHVIAPHLGILYTSAMVGGCMPLAVGAAFSIKQRGSQQVSLVFFGDGVLEEGAFYEAINMAALWKLPILFLCENNSVPPEQRAAGQYPSSTHAAKQLVDVPRSFSIPSEVVDGADVGAVYTLTADFLARIRRGEGPLFIEARTTRWPGNLGMFPQLVGGDWALAWAWDGSQAPPELRDWVQGSDPIALYARGLVGRGIMGREGVASLDREVQKVAEGAARFALESPSPAPETALEAIFA